MTLTPAVFCHPSAWVEMDIWEPQPIGSALPGRGQLREIQGTSTVALGPVLSGRVGLDPGSRDAGLVTQSGLPSTWHHL